MPHSVRGRARAQCIAVGTAVPERRLTNAELEKMVDTTDEWIVSRTGIRERRIAPPGQGLSHLAIAAGKNCLAQAGVAASDLDGIIVATITGDYVMPSTANLVQHGLGATKAWGFDLLNACNGFVAALSAATAYIESGHASRILVVGGDIMSSVVDYRDRNTCILFGDGCGAVLVEAGPPEGRGVVDFEMHSDGAAGGDLIIPCSGSAGILNAEALARGDQYVKQNGIVVFQQAIRRMAEVCESLLGRLSLTGADVDLLVPHQANKRIIEPTAKRLGLASSKVVLNIDRMANTTAATIPLALADAAADGRLVPGSRVLLAAFGGGLTWGACYLTWGRT
ncbi:MAG: ketoacyl-ACP synthase III [Planctomycetes bacterium]|nr:ketoacyl-ACP synthase III [Planctomycetota bacterium]